jgi:glycosyltransferase involved in cell wall biosynthesis
MEKLSVVIITFNEERNLGRCLDSVLRIADEIVVLDSFSTDGTLTIAGARGAKVYQESFAGYTEQKNRALALASFPFALSLDADEAIDQRLEAAILSAKAGGLQGAYTMNRCTNYCGKFIRHGSWYPDRKLRLFDRRQAKWTGFRIHERVDYTGTPIHLRGDILHYSYDALEEHVTQNNRFSTLSAQAYFEQGKRSSWFKMLVNPAWAFVGGYIFRLGFLDGFRGFVIAVNVAHLTFMKYYKLYALAKGIPVSAAASLNSGVSRPS